jgi:hypothetical protein
MQNYVGAVVDVCGSGRIRFFDAIPQFAVTFVINTIWKHWQWENITEKTNAL